MKTLNKLLLSTILMAPTFAADPSFNNLSSSDVDNISKEFSASSAHRPISPASPLGAIFGFEVGFVAGIADAPKIGEISKRESPSEEALDKLPHAGLYASVSVPFGITPELIYFPESKLGDVTFSHVSFGVKWTFSKLLPIPLVDIAARVHTSASDLSFSDTVDGVNTTVNLDNKTSGITLLASMNLLVFEPFVGLGYVSRSTDIGATGSAQIFDTTYTSAQSISVDGSSSQIIIGAQANLFIAKFALQHERIFGTGVTSAKLTFGF